MELLKFLFLISMFCRVSLTESTHSEEHEDAFHNMTNILGLNETLRLEDVNSILTQLDIRHCSNATNKCVTAESLFKIFNISNTTLVDKDKFSKFAPIIVYALLPIEHHSDDDEDKDDHHHDDHDEDDHDDHAHDEDDDHDKDDHDKNDHDKDNDHDEDGEKEITQNINVYKELLERYQTGVLCEQVIDQLLNDVNPTKGQPHFAGNMRLIANGNVINVQALCKFFEHIAIDECFSSDDIFHERNISSDVVLGKSHLREISVSIVSRLIQRQCIEVRYQSPLPCSSYFGNNLFKEYAENGVISKEKMEELLKKLKLGDEHDEEHHESEHDEEHHDHDDHNHRRRRSLKIAVDPLQSQFQENELRSQRRYRRETIHEHRNESTKYQKCYSVDELFAIYHVDRKTGFTQEEFERLTSALLQQIESEVCAKETHHEHSSSGGVDSKKKWGYGILTVAIISFCSLVGVAIIPFMHKVFYYKAVVFLISLAVGTLVGDALLHLFPHALAFHAGHDHGHDGHDSEAGENEDRDYLWKFLVASAAIYGFFLFETLTHLFFRKSIGHSHSTELEHTRRHSQFSGHEHEYGRNTADDCVTNMAYMNDEELANQRSGNPASTMNEKKTPIVFENGSNSNKSSEVKEKTEVKKKIASVAWNIIIGDTIHNVADGIAIGVAFSNSITGGVSTAIAVFCHELPHELGDFAVLLSAGMSVKKAVLANFLSACSCFIGFIFGVLISDFEDVNLWIFALTGGFFLYIALTNMLPELMHSNDFSVIPKFSRFLLQNLGILTGFAIMLLLSYYEEDINI